MEKSLVLASNNKGKLREFQAMFAELGVDRTMCAMSL